MSAAFRTICQSLGISAQALQLVSGASMRAVRYWWADGEPPAEVLEHVLALDAAIQQTAERAAALAREHAADMGGKPEAVTLTTYRTAERWWAAHPEYSGLPLNTHSIILRTTQRELEAAGFRVEFEWDTPNPDRKAGL